MSAWAHRGMGASGATHPVRHNPCSNFQRSVSCAAEKYKLALWLRQTWCCGRVARPETERQGRYSQPVKPRSFLRSPSVVGFSHDHTPPGCAPASILLYLPATMSTQNACDYCLVGNPPHRRSHRMQSLDSRRKGCVCVSCCQRRRPHEHMIEPSPAFDAAANGG
eukprot:COSAG01_NODE_834_length_13230_cov_18.826746_8_plen_165_part_00